MADTYGTDDHESMEHDGGHETLSHDEMADPNDEFGATAETHGEEQDAAASAGAVSARRSPLLPIVAAVGCLVILGGFAWYMFTSGDNVPAESPVIAERSPAALPMTLADGKLAQPAPAAASLLPAPVPADAKVAATKVPVDVGTPMPSPVAPAPVAPAPAAPVPPVAALVPSVTAAAPAKPVLVAPTTDISTDQRIENLTARMDVLQKALDQANQQLAQVATMTPVAPAPKDMQDRIDHLEQELVALKTSGSKPHHEAVVAAAAPAEGDGMMMSALAKSAAAHPAHHQVTHKPVKKHVAPVVVQDHWVLRAAMPGQAWVSTSAIGPDLKPLHVGDSLQGIGRVTGIEQENGNWIVRGSKGVIR